MRRPAEGRRANSRRIFDVGKTREFARSGTVGGGRFGRSGVSRGGRGAYTCSRARPQNKCGSNACAGGAVLRTHAPTDNINAIVCANEHVSRSRLSPEIIFCGVSRGGTADLQSLFSDPPRPSRPADRAPRSHINYFAPRLCGAPHRPTTVYCVTRNDAMCYYYGR